MASSIRHSQTGRHRPALEMPERVDEGALLDYCAQRMPRFAVPRFMRFIDALDKTASGKLRKGDLRDAGVTPETWDRESAGYTLARR